MPRQRTKEPARNPQVRWEQNERDHAKRTLIAASKTTKDRKMKIKAIERQARSMTTCSNRTFEVTGIKRVQCQRRHDNMLPCRTNVIWPLSNIPESTARCPHHSSIYDPLWREENNYSELLFQQFLR